MDENILTDDPNGTKPTDIIADGLEGMDGGLAETVERPLAAPAADDEDTSALAPREMRGFSDVRAYVKRNPVGVIIMMLVALIVAYFLLRAWRRTNNLPSLELIEQDARERIEAPTYSGGYFGNDDRLILTQVTVGTRQHRESAPEGSDLDETFGAMGYVTTDVMLTFQNESVIATKTAVLGYAKQNETWIDAGTVSDEQVSFVAIAGVDQRKVLRNIGQILERAGSATPPSDSLPSLASIYEGATYEIVSSTFDDVAQTDTLQIHARKGGLFSAYECDIMATFAFRPGNGLWELTEATVTDDAWVRRFDPIVDTWNGTFKSQEVSGGTKCLAGSSTPFVLTVDSWEQSGNGTRITGTISAVAHYHRNPEKDQNSTAGDERLDKVPFTATLLDQSDVQLGAEAVFTATLPEAVGGKTSITLQFGTGDDKAGVTATVTTEHHFEDTFILIPYQNQVIYADTYELVRAKPEDQSTSQDEPDPKAEPEAKPDEGAAPQSADGAETQQP